MARVCSACGKGKMSGNKVSHSNRRTRRTFDANIQKVKQETDGNSETVYLCTRCMKKQGK